jgi:hypothetical protein
MIETIQQERVMTKVMIEVFRTDVERPDHAATMVEKITNHFRQYQVNFDLDDCDRILRVKSSDNHVRSEAIIELLADHGFRAEVLE